MRAAHAAGASPGKASPGKPNPGSPKLKPTPKTTAPTTTTKSSSSVTPPPKASPSSKPKSLHLPSISPPRASGAKSGPGGSGSEDGLKPTAPSPGPPPKSPSGGSLAPLSGADKCCACGRGFDQPGDVRVRAEEKLWHRPCRDEHLAKNAQKVSAVSSSASVCVKCGLEITTSCITSNGDKYHMKCLANQNGPCPVCKVPFEDITEAVGIDDASVHNDCLQKYLSGDYDKGAATAESKKSSSSLPPAAGAAPAPAPAPSGPKCPKCKEVVSGGAVVCDGIDWHKACFLNKDGPCAVCGVAFKDFGDSCGIDGKSVHQACVDAYVAGKNKAPPPAASTSTAKPAESITPTESCVSCKKAFASTEPTVGFDGGKWHTKCFLNRDGPCAGGRELADMGDFVSIGGQSYHKDCQGKSAPPASSKPAPTTTTTATAAPSNEDAMAIVKAAMGLPASEPEPEQCPKCKKGVTTGAILVSGSRWHKECYMNRDGPCAFCGKPFTDITDVVSVPDDGMYHQKCRERHNSGDSPAAGSKNATKKAGGGNASSSGGGGGGCPRCNKLVTEAPVNFSGGTWHKRCFANRDGPCAFCGNEFEDMSGQVNVSGEGAFHEDCRAKMNKGAKPAAGSPMKAAAAQSHNTHDGLSSTGTSSDRERCAACEKPITGTILRAKGSTWHRDCYEEATQEPCSYCGKMVPASERAQSGKHVFHVPDDCIGKWFDKGMQPAEGVPMREFPVAKINGVTLDGPGPSEEFITAKPLLGGNLYELVDKNGQTLFYNDCEGTAMGITLHVPSGSTYAPPKHLEPVFEKDTGSPQFPKDKGAKRFTLNIAQHDTQPFGDLSSVGPHSVTVTAHGLLDLSPEMKEKQAKAVTNAVAAMPKVTDDMKTAAVKAAAAAVTGTPGQKVATSQALPLLSGVAQKELSEVLIAECQKKKARFVDPFFPCDASSVGSIPNHHKSDTHEEMEAKAAATPWMLPHDILAGQRRAKKEKLHEKVALVIDGISLDDIAQGGVGDCYFLAAVQAVATAPHQIERLLLPQSAADKEVGVYRVTLCIDGYWQEIIVDQFLPVFCSMFRFAHCNQSPNEMWVAALEKAFAKAGGHAPKYAAIDAGAPDFALRQSAFSALTGSPASQLPQELWATASGVKSDLQNCDKKSPFMKLSPDEAEVKIIAILKQHFTKKGLATIGTRDLPGMDKQGLVSGHAYTVLGAVDTMVDGASVRLVKLRNPWGNGVQWIGAWGPTSKLWQQHPAVAGACSDLATGRKYDPEESRKRGEKAFWMPLREVLKLMHNIGLCLPLDGCYSATMPQPQSPAGTGGDLSGGVLPCAGGPAPCPLPLASVLPAFKSTLTEKDRTNAFIVQLEAPSTNKAVVQAHVVLQCGHPSTEGMTFAMGLFEPTTETPHKDDVSVKRSKSGKYLSLKHCAGASAHDQPSIYSFNTTWEQTTLPVSVAPGKRCVVHCISEAPVKASGLAQLRLYSSARFVAASAKSSEDGLAVTLRVPKAKKAPLGLGAPFDLVADIAGESEDYAEVPAASAWQGVDPKGVFKTHSALPIVS